MSRRPENGRLAAVAANRISSAIWTTTQPKTLQEVITLTVFAVFHMGEALTWSMIVGFSLIAAGAAFVFLGKQIRWITIRGTRCGVGA